MDEFELIARLTQQMPANPAVIVGPGDDCAVLDFGLPQHWILFKTDAVVEGIHYDDRAAPEQIGHKALGRCLSDIAAMAGEPTSALVTVGLPRDYRPERVEAIYRGLNRLADQHRMAVVGGETTTSPERTFFSVAVIGKVKKEHCVLRSGARPGDAIFVTGELGGSLAGKHLSFAPRLAEARWLAEHFPLRGMIDLSDGLASDLRHVLRCGGVGAELLSDAIPISRAAKARYRDHLSPKRPLEAALTDGEDFELLFCAPAGDAVAVLDAWKVAFPRVRLSCIGKISAEPGIRLRDRRGQETLGAHGYIHFAQP
jgi:thiamine-monophosphate kinase